MPRHSPLICLKAYERRKCSWWYLFFSVRAIVGSFEAYFTMRTYLPFGNPWETRCICWPMAVAFLKYNETLVFKIVLLLPFTKAYNFIYCTHSHVGQLINYGQDAYTGTGGGLIFLNRCVLQCVPSKCTQLMIGKVASFGNASCSCQTVRPVARVIMEGKCRKKF